MFCRGLTLPDQHNQRSNQTLSSSGTTTSTAKTTLSTITAVHGNSTARSTLKRTATSVKDKVELGPFALDGGCSTPTGATASDLPDFGLDFETELEGTLADSNLTYKTATFSDGDRLRGVVAMDLWDGRKEIILYDLKADTTFHVRGTYNTVFAEIDAHPETNAHQKQWFFKGGSTPNRWLVMGDFSKGGGSTQNPWALMGGFSKGGVHKTDGLWWVIFQRGGRGSRQIRWVFYGFWNSF